MAHKLMQRFFAKDPRRYFVGRSATALVRQAFNGRAAQCQPSLRSVYVRPVFYSSRQPLSPQRRLAHYQRFAGKAKSSLGFLQAWAARPTFYVEIGGLAVSLGVIYTYNQEEVPISGRRRFNLISQEREKRMGEDQYIQLLKRYRSQILPESDSRTLQVRRVLDRLIPASGLANNQWEVHVVVSDEANAFVLPSGKVFVFTGILPLCQDDQGLAAVLGHEMAHNIAHHAAERMTQGGVLLLAALLLELTLGMPSNMNQALLDLTFHKPGSRKQESEADYIGLMLMVRSCFDPASAVEFWFRMEEHERRNEVPPQLLSTHPSSHNRRAQLQEWLPEAYKKRDASDCGPLARNLGAFRASMQRYH